MTRSVFISYRRDDSAGWAGRLADRLTQRLGDDGVFLDVDSIPAGSDFGETIEARLDSVDTTLVMIGPNWLGTEPIGQRRIDDPNDFVRREIATALAGSHRVVPVLVEGASMPPSDHLPDEIASLALRNAVRLHDDSFDASVERLLVQIGLDGGSSSAPAPHRDYRFVMALSVAALILVLGFGYFAFVRGDDESGGGLTSTSSNPGTSSTTSAPTTTSSSTMPAVLEPVAISGVLTAETSTGRPLPDGSFLETATVSLSSLLDELDESAETLVRPGPSGAFAFSDVVPGDYLVRIDAPGFRPVEMEVVASDSDVRLDPVVRAFSGSVEGRLVDELGIPVGGASVNLSNTLGYSAVGGTPTIGDVGTFRFENVEAPSTLLVQVERAGYAISATSLQIQSGETRVVDMYLLRTSSALLVSVLDANGQGIGAAKVTVTSSGGYTASLFTSTSGEVGVVAFDEIESSGNHQLIVEQQGFETLVVPIKLDQGVSLVINVTLTATS